MSIQARSQGGGGGGGVGGVVRPPSPPPLTAEGPHFGHTSSTRGMNPFLELS